MLTKMVRGERGFRHKKNSITRVSITKMVGKTGFEPATPWSQTKCSTKLSHFPINGAPEGIRTPDLLVRSQTLYPAELRAQVKAWVRY